MSSMVQKHDQQQSDKNDLDNSQEIIIKNHDSNKYNHNNNKNISAYRKTSKRRQAQQEKAIVLQLFKDLIKVVNQKFQNAYLSPPKCKPPKLPKIIKNLSMKPSKKQENLKKKEQNLSAHINNNRNQDKSQSRELSQPAFPSNQIVNHHHLNANSHSSPLPFQTFNSSSYMSGNIRKGSQSHLGHREKSLNEKHNVLKEALKKQIFDNYSVQMKYIIHQDFEQEYDDERNLDQGSKMIDQSNEYNGMGRAHKFDRNQNQGQQFDDLQLLSHEQKMHQQFIKSMKHIDNNIEPQEKLINEELQKCLQQEASQSSSSSCEQNQKYPPHSHMPQGHATTTQQFLQQHHPIITTLPHSSENLIFHADLHPKESQQNNENIGSVGKIEQSHKNNQ